MPVPAGNESETREASDLFKRFRGHDPESVSMVSHHAPKGLYGKSYKTALMFGECDGIHFDDLNDESRELEFEGEKPVIAASHDGEQLFLIGGSYQVPRSERQKAQPEKGVLLLGIVESILYTTERDGEIELYIHKFKKQSRPCLATSIDGSQLYLLAGAYSFTELGIIDTD